MKKIIDDMIVAIFCYKQSAYIEGAIKSIFNQTVWPKKLYIFDDCSPDDTETVIEKTLMEKPEGLNIEFIKNECNVGLVSQFNKLKGMFNDTLIVVQAGDDMSKPQRLEKQYQAWKEQRDVKLILSQFDKIDEHGNFVSGRDEGEVFDDSYQSIIERQVLPAGCTAAIDSSLFNDFPEIDKEVINEDRVFIFRSRLKGKSIKLMESLIDYRYDVGISALKQRTKEEFINKWKVMYERELIDLRMNIKDAKTVGNTEVVKALDEKHLFVEILRALFNGEFDSKAQAWKAYFSRGVKLSRLFKFNRRVKKYFRNSSY
ncbi:TPA: glycosyltransferase [Vibrio parahaemolyticus]|nr:glycosyltransferase [Vibrio parahaemolyticus]